MYEETLSDVEDAAVTKANMARERLPAYLIHSAMAGSYVGLGIVLILALGTPLHAAGSPFTGLVMAATFGVALSLVIVAGSDLFTGNTMILAVGTLRGETSRSDLAAVWSWSWLGNLAGSALVAGIAAGAGIFATDTSLLAAVATGKITASGPELFLKAILCNWLVVLSVWSAIKLDNEVAQLVMVWWCLLAFIGSGYEHSVANMTLLTLANLTTDAATVTWGGMAHNLLWVTAGNVVSGATFMGAAYYWVTESHADLTAGREERDVPTASQAD